MRKVILSLAFLGFSWSGFAQSTSNESLSLQACQGDTIVFGFNITSPFNIGNTFSVEMSDASGNFAGNFVSTNALLAYGVSVGNAKFCLWFRDSTHRVLCLSTRHESEWKIC